MSSRNRPGEQTLLMEDGTTVVLRRSARRKRTVSAFWEEGTAVVAIPSTFTRAEEHEWAQRMLRQLRAKEQRSSGRGRPGSDAELMARAEQLSAQYLDARARPVSVRWVSNQNGRWGSATPAERTIRLSDKLQGMPAWVVDYVLIHELAHLLVAGHGAQFWALCEAYPRTAEARAFLNGVAFAQARGLNRAPATGGAAGNDSEQSGAEQLKGEQVSSDHFDF